MHRTRNDLSLRTRTAMVELLNARLADALDLSAQTKQAQALANAYATFGKAVRKAAGMAGDAGDEGTADLFTGISRDTDKYLWMLEAHL